jgi:hypothetical protein
MYLWNQEREEHSEAAYILLIGWHVVPQFFSPVGDAF